MACATVNTTLCLIGCRYVRRDVRCSTAALITAFASLELAAPTRPAATITLMALERCNAAWATAATYALCLMGCRYVRRDVRYSTEALPDAFASLEPAASTRPAPTSDPCADVVMRRCRRRADLNTVAHVDICARVPRRCRHLRNKSSRRRLFPSSYTCTDTNFTLHVRTYSVAVWITLRATVDRLLAESPGPAFGSVCAASTYSRAPPGRYIWATLYYSRLVLVVIYSNGR